MAKEKEAKKDPKALVAANKGGLPVPSGKPAGAGRGLENIERSDILLPRLKLLQPLSPEVTGELGQEAGSIFLNLTNKSYGKKILITPILHFRSRIKWTDRDDGGGIDCSSPDARKPMTDKYATNCAVCGHSQWNNEAKKKKEQAPSCTLYDNFLVLVGDSEEPVLLPMERTKAKAAKKFYSMASLRGGDFWNFQYELASVKEKNADDQAYFNYQVTGLDKPTDAKRRVICETLWTNLSGKAITADMSSDKGEAGAGAEAGEAVGSGKAF